MKDESTTSEAVRDGDRVSAAKQQRAAKSREGRVHAEPNPSGIISWVPVSDHSPQRKKATMSDFNAKIIEEFRVNGGTMEFEGVPLILLHHIGAMSGTERVTPVVCYPQSDGSLAVMAANGGAPRHPDWYKNLKAHPQAEVEFGPEIFKVAVRELGGSERDALWMDALRTAPQLREIQEKTLRQIPVLLLTRITEVS